jgi:DNA-binding transcriptional MocR family regulator
VVERRVGSGTFATGSAALGLPSGREGSGLVARLVDQAEETGTVDLSLSVLRDADDLPDVHLDTADLARAAPDTGYGPRGQPGLRMAVAELLRRWGLASRAEQIVITTGAQQAISLAAACWVRPGDPVGLDDPTYPGALSAFTAAGAELRAIAIDGSGPRPDDLGDVLERHPALVYLQTTLHSPTGTVVGRARREQLATMIRASRVPVVEDVALAGLAWAPSPPPLAAWMGDHPVAVVGSLSKLLWGGLRLGFVRAPEPVAQRFARVKATHDLGTSVASQLLAERLLRHPELPDRLAGRRAEHRTRAGLLRAELARLLPEWEVPAPAGGLSLWVRLPRPVAARFAQVALRHGVAVATAEALSAGDGHRDRIRLSFAGPPDELKEGVARLAAAWSAVPSAS